MLFLLLGDRKGVIQYTMSEKWIRDTGLMFILVSLVVVYRGSESALFVAGLLTIIILFAPSLLRPLAWVWLKIAEGLGFVMQRIFFGLVFFVVVTPIGLLRRAVMGDARDCARDISRSTAFVPGVGVVVREYMEKPY